MKKGSNPLPPEGFVKPKPPANPFIKKDTKLLELKMNWLLMSRTYYRMHNLHFDKWLVGLELAEKEWQNEVLPLLMQMAQSSRGGMELLELTLEIEQEWGD